MHQYAQGEPGIGSATVHLATRRSGLNNMQGKLESLSPVAVLHRGYAIVQDESGAVLHSTEQIANGQTVFTRLGDGSFVSQVSRVSPTRSDQRE